LKCLLKFISCWLHALDIAAAFEELADACYEKLLTRRAQVCHAAGLVHAVHGCSAWQQKGMLCTRCCAWLSCWHAMLCMAAEGQ
jgi:hypothetical protein